MWGKPTRNCAKRPGIEWHLGSTSLASGALDMDRDIQVFDIWESRAAFDSFGATLVPILTAAGIGMNEPMVAQVHNEIKG